MTFLNTFWGWHPAWLWLSLIRNLQLCELPCAWAAVSVSLPAELCPRQSISQAAQLIVVTVHGLQSYRLSTSQAASADNAAFISRQENVTSYLRLNTGITSMASLFSRACLVEPRMYLFLGLLPASCQPGQIVCWGNLRKMFRGWVGACQVHSSPWHLEETFCALSPDPSSLPLGFTRWLIPSLQDRGHWTRVHAHSVRVPRRPISLETFLEPGWSVSGTGVLLGVQISEEFATTFLDVINPPFRKRLVPFGVCHWEPPSSGLHCGSVHL